jgi:hypothetical protein
VYIGRPDLRSNSSYLIHTQAIVFDCTVHGSSDWTVEKRSIKASKYSKITDVSHSIYMIRCQFGHEKHIC